MYFYAFISEIITGSPIIKCTCRLLQESSGNPQVGNPALQFVCLCKLMTGALFVHEYSGDSKVVARQSILSSKGGNSLASVKYILIHLFLC